MTVYYVYRRIGVIDTPEPTPAELRELVDLDELCPCHDISLRPGEVATPTLRSDLLIVPAGEADTRTAAVHLPPTIPPCTSGGDHAFEQIGDDVEACSLCRLHVRYQAGIVYEVSMPLRMATEEVRDE